jgi:hypothetical protein
VLDKKNKSCRKKYCEQCLRKFYHEDVNDIADRSNWACPSCRKLCCCAACRRKDNRESPMMSPFESPASFLPRANGASPAIPSIVVAAAAAASSVNAGKVSLPPMKSSGNSTSSTPSFGPTAAASVPDQIAMMYAASLIPSVQKMITDTLARTDLSESQKLEQISSMLNQRAGSSTPSAPSTTGTTRKGNGTKKEPSSAAIPQDNPKDDSAP